MPTRLPELSRAGRRVSARNQTAAGGFNPETDITWHSLFWAEGTNFIAQGYTDTDPVGTWPNETSETDATQGTAPPLYRASSINGQPAVDFPTGKRGVSAAFGVNPTYPLSIVAIARKDGTVTSTNTLTDGDASGRNNIYAHVGGKWRNFAGSAEVSSTSNHDTAAHLFVSVFDGSSGADSMEIDGTSESSSNAGSGQIDTLWIGMSYNVDRVWNGPVPLLGLYPGNFTADTEYTNFTTWVTGHYGITLA